METSIQTSRRVKRVYNIMRLTYGLVPVVAGLDKFTGLLTNWDRYLNPAVAQLLPFTPHAFMMIVGVVEMIAGVIVLLKPTAGGYIVMAWLILISLSLLASEEYLDVAVRDLVMAVGAYSLAQIARTVISAKAEHEAGAEMAFS